MCELLGMSSRVPTTLHRSMTELARHGGETGPHRDGWGVGLIEDGDAVVVREPAPACASQWLACWQTQAPPAAIAVAHIRRATQGAPLLRNTQPFARELGGRVHLFAHNGMLTGIEADPRFGARRFRRVGDTDSEHAFCALLERLAPLWDGPLPPLAARHACVVAFARALGDLGPANFLYTDGDVLFAHGHRRRHDDGELRAPGLHLLCRHCAADADAGVAPAPDQDVTLVASVPLSAEPWRPLAEGELAVVRGGRWLSAAEIAAG